MSKLQKSSVIVMAAAMMSMAICHAARANRRSPPPVLVVVTTPTASGQEADIARSLIPQGIKGNYKLEPFHKLKDSKKAGSTKDIEDRAKVTIQKAREAALSFDLVPAARLKRQTADDLLKTEIVALEPSLTATYLLEAGAASAEAGENDLALIYFRKALAVDGSARPGPLISPKAKEVFESALSLGPMHLKNPNARILKKLCSGLDVEGILWISVGRDEEGLVISDKLLLLEQEYHEPEALHHLLLGTKEEIEKWVSKERARLDTTISLKLAKKPGKDKPWYKKWWIYATVGGMLLAGAAASVAIASSLEPSEVDVVVHH